MSRRRRASGLAMSEAKAPYLLCAVLSGLALLAAPWIITFLANSEETIPRSKFRDRGGSTQELREKVKALQAKLDSLVKAEPTTSGRPPATSQGHSGPQPTVAPVEVTAAPKADPPKADPPKADPPKADPPQEAATAAPRDVPAANKDVPTEAPKESGPLPSQAECVKKCGCVQQSFAIKTAGAGEPHTFKASSDEARGLFEGCDSSQVAKKRPHLMVIGAEKAGPGAVGSLAHGHYCLPEHPEPHFFDRTTWYNRTPTLDEVERLYTEREWAHCRSPQMPRYDSSPSAYLSPHAALRTCQRLGKQKLLLLLRNPIDRAFSSFHRFQSRYPAIFAQGLEGFDRMVRADVAIFQQCGGMPSGDLRRDEAASAQFAACCEKVTNGLSLSNWPGCRCPGVGDQWECQRYGDRAHGLVRAGIYVNYTRNWFRYHRTDDVLLSYAETFFMYSRGDACEVRCFAEPKSAMELCGSLPSRDWSMIMAHSRDRQPMWKSTRQFLQDFYGPYNKDLYALLGKSANWNFETRARQPRAYDNGYDQMGRNRGPRGIPGGTDPPPPRPVNKRTDPRGHDMERWRGRGGAPWKNAGRDGDRDPDRRERFDPRVDRFDPRVDRFDPEKGRFRDRFNPDKRFDQRFDPDRRDGDDRDRDPRERFDPRDRFDRDRRDPDDPDRRNGRPADNGWQRNDDEDD